MFYSFRSFSFSVPVAAVLLLLCPLLTTTLCVAQPYRTIAHHHRMLRPAFLQEGDSIGIVNISSKCSDNAEVNDSLIGIVRSWGLKVRLGTHLYDQSGGWFPASDALRASDLQQMIDAPAIKAILFFRGGYGAVRTFDYLDLRSLRRHPKWMIGYSDITAIHSAMGRMGIESIHGTMPISFLQDPSRIDSSMLSLRDALFGRVPEYHTTPHPLNQYGEATGRLTGGNLSLICNMLGGDVDDFGRRGSILLIEDVSESAYAIDRMMQSLWRSGRLKNVRAILVGHFTNISEEERWGSSVQELIKHYTEPLHIPVIFNFPSGHDLPNYSLYLGRQVKVKVDSTGGCLTFCK